MTSTTAMLPTNTSVTDRIRRGIVYDKWPLRLDVDTEYQDWIIIGMVFVILLLWCMPCLCLRMRNRCSRSFSQKVYKRLHIFFIVVTYLNMVIVMFTIGILPDWTVNQFLLQTGVCIVWILTHLQKLIYSFTILAALYLLIKFRDRIYLAAGVEHMTVIRLDWRDCFGVFPTRKRPIEIFLWKVEGLKSSKLKSNDIFIELHLGNNEPMRTRVHNNAGHNCIVKESLQLNMDESSTGQVMTLFVKDQSLVASSELGRLMLSTREIKGIEDQTGKRRVDFQYNEESFIPLNLLPQGTVWVAIAPVEDRDEERTPLMDDSLVTC